MRASGQTKSLWMQEKKQQYCESLSESLECDVCIVGGGITGLTAAYLLGRDGFKVILVTAADADGGETLRTTVHLTALPDYRYHEIVERHGFNAAQLLMNSHINAIDFIESKVAEHNIDCQFKRVDGYLFAAPKTSLNVLKTEAKICRKLGFGDIEEIKHLELIKGKPHALRFGNQAQFNVAPYLEFLQEIGRNSGVRFFGNTQVTGVNKSASTVTVTIKSGDTIKANSVVIATGSPITDILTLPFKQFPYRTYVIAGRVNNSEMNENLYWDTGDPYHYVRFHTDKNGNQHIVGGKCLYCHWHFW